MNTQAVVSPVESSARAFKGAVGVTNSVLTRFRRHGGEALRQDLEHHKNRCINTLMHLQPPQRRQAVESAGFAWSPQAGELLNAALKKEASNWQKRRVESARPFNAVLKVEVSK